jgi:hypothetical protein
MKLSDLLAGRSPDLPLTDGNSRLPLKEVIRLHGFREGYRIVHVTGRLVIEKQGDGGWKRAFWEPVSGQRH